MTDIFSPPPWRGQGYYPAFSVPEDLALSPELNAALAALATERYREIDHRQGATARVREAFERVVSLLEGAPPGLDGHRRQVTLGLILAMACRQSLRLYATDDPRPARVVAMTLAWIATATPFTGPVGEALFPLVATRHQPLDEAIEVHRLLSRMPGEPAAAASLLLEILELTLDGYAIRAPGTDDRDLLHWWLSVAVPAAWHCRLPEHIFNGDWPWPPQHTP